MGAATWVSLAISIAALLIAAWARFEGWRETQRRRRDSAALQERLQRSRVADLGARQQEEHAGNLEDVYVFTIENAGPSVAKGVTARVVEWDEEAGRGLEDTVVREDVKVAMAPGNDVHVTFHVPAQFRNRDLRLWASWSDDTEERHEDVELARLRPPRVHRHAGFH